MSKGTCSIEGCEREMRARTWCSTHWARWKSHGDPLKGAHVRRWDEFMRLFLTDTTECVEWPGAQDGSGYGQIRKFDRTHQTHRLALQMLTDMDGDGLEAAHGPCHNRLCMNACGGHVTWKTPIENQHDKLRDGTHLVGEQCAGAKLTAENVLAIRNDPRPQQVIANHYGIGNGHVSNIKSRKRWTWL